MPTGPVERSYLPVAHRGPRVIIEGNVSPLVVASLTPTMQEYVEKHAASVISHVQQVEVPLAQRYEMSQALSSTRRYLEHEFTEAGIPSDHIKTINPIFIYHTEKDKRSVLGYESAGVPFVFVDSTGFGFGGAITQAHEMSHAAATRVTYVIDNLEVKQLRGDTGFDRIVQASLDTEATVYKPGFLEDTMATWDSYRVMKQVVSQGMFAEEVAERRKAADNFRQGRMRGMERSVYGAIFPTENLEFFVSPEKKRFGGEKMEMSFIEWQRLAVVQGVARAIGFYQAGHDISPDDAIEKGRRVLQKSRLSGSDEARTTITNIFGDSFTEKLFATHEDPIFVISLMEGLAKYEQSHKAQIASKK